MDKTTNPGVSLLVAWVVGLTLAGCNCSPPLVVPADGGSAGGGSGGSGGSGGTGGSGGGFGGSGGGSGADAGLRECTSAAQCTKAPPSQSLCSFTPSDAGNSCIDGRCVYECFQGRTCDFDAGTSCLACATPPATQCVQPGCGAMTLQVGVETVGPGCTVGFMNAMLVPLGNCQWKVTDATGDKGTITRLQNGHYVGTFTDHGTCVGANTFGQVERVVFSCPNCQFQVVL